MLFLSKITKNFNQLLKLKGSEFEIWIAKWIANIIKKDGKMLSIVFVLQLFTKKKKRNKKIKK